MARDFIAVPGMSFCLFLFLFLFFFLIEILINFSGTSVPVERIFSGGTDVITDKRSNLKKETIQALMCLRNWIKKDRPVV